MPRKAKTRKTARKKTSQKATTRRTMAKRKIAKRATTKRTAGRRKTAASKKKTTARKKTTTRRTASKRKAPASAKKVSVTGLKQAYTKAQVMTYLAECTELGKKDITNVFDALGHLMSHHLKSRGPGEFTVPGLMKCVVKRKPATKARKGINPFTGEPMTFKAKPARNIVKIRALKRLKEMVE